MGSKKVSILSKIFFVLACLLCYVSGQAIELGASSSPRPKLGDQELLRIFKNKKPINHRTVNASGVLQALRWAQLETTVRNAESLPTLSITDSVIQGDLNLSSLRSERATLASVNKNMTCPAADILVPVGLDFEGSIFQAGREDEEFPSVDFNDAIFKEGVSWSGVVFDMPATFSRAFFTEDAKFDGASFKSFGGFECSSFESDVSFSGAVFQGRSSFIHTQFLHSPDFVEAVFRDRVYFGGSRFGSGANFAFTKFQSSVSFAQSHADGVISFSRAAFSGDAFFNGFESGKKGELAFTSISFGGPVYFNHARLHGLWFSSRPMNGIPGLARRRRQLNQDPLTPIIFEKKVILRDAICANAGFADVEFRGYADFGNVAFLNFVTFARSTFEGDAAFQGTSFPRWQKAAMEQGAPGEIGHGLVLDGTIFHKSLDIEWEQLAGKVNTRSSDTWKSLESYFQKSGDLRSQNEAMYQRRSLERKRSAGWESFENDFENIFWGYSVRPLRLCAWILLSYLIFAVIYWTQTRPLSTGEDRWRGIWRRWKFALDFGYQTSWKPLYGYEQSLTPLFKALTLLHSAVFKIMFVCLLWSMSKVSPLLHELLGKILPV